MTYLCSTGLDAVPSAGSTAVNGQGLCRARVSPSREAVCLPSTISAGGGRVGRGKATVAVDKTF